MRRNVDEGGWLLMIVMILVVLGLAWVVSIVHCHQAWSQSGMRAQFQLFAGCLLEHQPGIWIPAKNYREVP